MNLNGPSPSNIQGSVQLPKLNSFALALEYSVLRVFLSKKPSPGKKMAIRTATTKRKLSISLSSDMIHLVYNFRVQIPRGFKFDIF